MAKPKIVTDKQLEFLDDLWEADQVKFFNAIRWLSDEFKYLDKAAASKVLLYWHYLRQDKKQ